MQTKFPLLPELVEFITERQNIHLKRQAGKPAPWTTDPILQQYRFCNVRREDDRVTRWVHTHWLHSHAADPDVWFAMYVARVFNQPRTLAAVGYSAPWTTSLRRRVRMVADAATGTVYNAAYIVSTNGVSMNKTDYYLQIFDNLWAARKDLRPRQGDTLVAFHKRLTSMNAVGSFMGAQVVADAKWVEPLKSASDWSTFASSGPGSRRGLNRVCGRAVGASWKECEWHATLLELRAAVLPKLPKELRDLDAQNSQNCLCEFDKLRRAVEGGRPKQNFRSSELEY